MLDSTWVVEWLKLSARIAHEKRDEWVDLDRAIGDGDHGENLDRGFSAAYEAVQKAGDVDAARLIYERNLQAEVDEMKRELFGI